MAKKIVIIGSLDTKSEEFLYVKNILEAAQLETLVINTGTYESAFEGDITNVKVAEAGGSSIKELEGKKDRGTAVSVMTKGVTNIVEDLINKGEVSGLFGMGGTAGTTVAAAAMKKAPVGMPKMIISTVASGNTRPYVGDKDVTMMYSVVDISGINRLSAKILRNGANALAGMVRGAEEEIEIKIKPTIGATMFGVTTPCVTQVREQLEKNGLDVLVFHATGAGGDAMESLIEGGFIDAVVDITTTELADGLVGGIFQSSEKRLEIAGSKGIPQVISVGALDMVNFGPPETVPAKFKGRTFYQHNATTTLMRTTKEENAELGKLIAKKSNQSLGPTVVIFPKGGVSMLDATGQAFEDIHAREALYNSIQSNLNENISFIEMDGNINDTVVSKKIADTIIELMN